jgi:uncharacterized membrane protein
MHQAYFDAAARKLETRQVLYWLGFSLISSVLLTSDRGKIPTTFAS